MVSLIVSMSSNPCIVSNRFLKSSWNSIFFDPIRVASTLGSLINVFLSTSTSSLMLHITSLWSLPMLTWLMTITSMSMYGLFVRMLSISVFVTPVRLFHVHLLLAFFWNMVFMILYFLDVAHSTKVSPLSFFNSSPYFSIVLSIGFVRFHI